MHADVAQLVAHHLAKVDVAGSSPVVRSHDRLSISNIDADYYTVEWPRGEAQDCKSCYTGSNPVSTSTSTSSEKWNLPRYYLEKVRTGNGVREIDPTVGTL